MASVTYAPGIDYVQGSLAKPKKQNGHKCGDYLIGTHRTAPTTNKECTRLYVRKADTYGNNVSQTSLAINARNRFTAVSQAIATRRRNVTLMASDLAAFKAQKDQPNGKKTLTAYYWLVCGQEYDQAHNG